MAPDAPAPTYDEEGNRQLEWLVVTRYDPARGVVTISWSKDGDLFRQSKRGAVACEADDAPAIFDAMERTVRMLADPTLF